MDDDGGHRQLDDDGDRCEACGREADSPLGIPWAGWRDILWRVQEEIRQDDMVIVAAGVAFFGFTAFVPLTGTLVALYGMWADPHQVTRHLASLSEILPSTGGNLVRAALEDVVERSPRHLGIGAVMGVLITLWSASRGMRSLLRALSIAYDEKSRRGWIHHRLLSVGVTALVIVVSALTISVVVALPAPLALLGISDATNILLGRLRWPFLGLVSVAALSCLYRWGADREPPKWRWVVLGALVATGLWTIGSMLLSFYVHRIEDVESSYGPFGAVLVVMFWLFISAFAVLLGAEINAESEHQTGVDTTTGPQRPLGERGAYVADHLGACRPPLENVIRRILRSAIRAARRAASRLRDGRR